MKSRETGALCDTGMNSVAQKVEHNEIASYGTLHQFTESLVSMNAVALLEATLKQENATDTKPSKAATGSFGINGAVEDVPVKGTGTMVATKSIRK